jgi:hypothetical protein
MDLQEIGWGAWIDLAQDWEKWRALVNAVTNLRVPQNAEKFLDQLKNYHLPKKDFSCMELSHPTPDVGSVCTR